MCKITSLNSVWMGIFLLTAGSQHNLYSSAVGGSAICPSGEAAELGEIFAYPIHEYQNREPFPYEIVYNCSVHDRFPDVFKKCSYIPACLVEEENIIAAQEGITWNVSTRLCSFRHNLGVKHINIYVLGGSVTAGSGTKGCSCLQNINPKQTCKKKRKKNCEWASLFGGWAQRTYGKAHISVHNLAIVALDSRLMSYRIGHTFASRNITLHSHDLIFLDHSINDFMESAEEGLDRLIRTIYNYVDKSMLPPTIILLDMIGRKIYEKTAAYYNLLLWSYANVIKENKLSNRQQSYKNYLNSKWNKLNDVHLGWPVHMFYSDLLAILLNRTLTDLNCSEDNNEETTTSSFTLPPPLSKERLISCAQPAYITLDFYQPSLNQSLTSQYSILPPESWKHFEDRPNKFGLVTTSLTNNATLSIPLHYKDNNSNSVTLDYHIFFRYMKTYLNAGVVEFELCGHVLRVVDALWTYVNLQLVSVPEEEYLQISRKDIQNLCTNRNRSSILNIRHYLVHETHVFRKQARKEQKFKLEYIEVCTLLK